MIKEEKSSLSQIANIPSTACTPFSIVLMHKILWLTLKPRRIYCVASRRDTVCGKLDCSREVEILVGRLFSLWVAIGLSSMTGLWLAPLSVAHAAHPVWSAYATQPKRPQFRPLQRTGRESVLSRWRPHASTTPRTVNPVTSVRTAGSSTGHRVRQIPFSLDHHGAAATSRSSPAREGGGQFRPQRHGPTYAQSAAGRDRPQASGYPAGLQSQFRPMRAQRRPSYEELQSGSKATLRAAASGTTYPMMLARGALGYAGHWPGW
jgi:hypothetical protein